MIPAVSATPRTILDGLIFPECPRWHEGVLFFSDMHAGVVWSLTTDGYASRIADVSGGPAGLAWGPDEALRIVSMHDRQLLRLGPEGLSVVADLSAFVSSLTNDMVIDQAGRAYIGNFGFDLYLGEPPRPTVLLRVDPDGEVRVAAEDLMFPNGTVITPDGHTLIVAETFASRLTAFDIQPDGSLSDRRVFANLEGISPDGICLDAEGALWITCPFGNRIIRVREGGEIADNVPLPGRDSFACMLGGADRRDLYICTAPHFLPEHTTRLRSGRIELLHVEVPGVGLP